MSTSIFLKTYYLEVGNSTNSLFLFCFFLFLLRFAHIGGFLKTKLFNFVAGGDQVSIGLDPKVATDSFEGDDILSPIL